MAPAQTERKLRWWETTIIRFVVIGFAAIWVLMIASIIIHAFLEVN